MKAKDGTDESTDAPQTKKEEEEEFGYSGLGALSPGTPHIIGDRLSEPAGSLRALSSRLCAQLSIFYADDRVALQPVGELFTKSKWREAIELCKQLMQTRDKRVRPRTHTHTPHTRTRAYALKHTHARLNLGTRTHALLLASQ